MPTAEQEQPKPDFFEVDHEESLGGGMGRVWNQIVLALLASAAAPAVRADRASVRQNAIKYSSLAVARRSPYASSAPGYCGGALPTDATIFG
jgi:hypothetical protein